MRFRTPRAAQLVFATVWLLGTGTAVAQSAKDILDATGVSGGLVVHLGCGDGRLTAGLRADEGYLVHGLDVDRESVHTAREYVNSLGIYGNVSVERIDGQRLPYVDNLVNLVVAEDRLESVWPVHGSVLVLDGVVYFAAGRSSFLDGGIRLYGLDAYSGRTLYETTVAAAPPRPGKKAPGEKTTGALPDVLVSDGRTVNMRHLQFDPGLVQRDVAELKTLVTTTGFLEDCWAHRLNWHLGHAQKINSHANAGSLRSNRPTGRNPFGKLLAFDDRCVYGVQSLYTFLKHTKEMHPPTHDGHLHQKYARYKAGYFPIGGRIYAQEGDSLKWRMDVPLQVRAMVLADRVLFLAGWRDSVGIEEGTGTALSDESEDRQKAVLWAVSSEDGKKLAEYELSSQPVFDGMIAAAGRLYIALKDGTVLCMGPDC